MNLFQALDTGYNILKSIQKNSYKIDTELLLCDSLNISRENLILNLNRDIGIKRFNNFLSKIQRRKANEPIAYILKKKEFWKNEFYINENVLVPRPETEHLVEETLCLFSNNQKKRLLEIGVGSGCLIISILKDRKNCSAIAIDYCKKAIKIAKINAKLHQIENRIKFFKSDVDKFNRGKYDLILSTPPYIEKHRLKYLGVSDHEPLKALNGGINGVEILAKVIKKSSQLLNINGKLIIEIGSNQKYKVIKILKKNKFYINKITKDLSNYDRCIVATKIL